MKKMVLSTLLFIASSFAFGQTKIAVLPYLISYEGRISKKLTPEQLVEMRKQDAAMYQSSMINYLNKYNRKKKNQSLNLEVLSVSQINQLLADSKLSVASLDTLTNDEIAKLLKIAYVVRGNSTRTFIMSDELSMGITILNSASGSNVFNATSLINITNTLEETEGFAVQSRQFQRKTSATLTDNQNLRDVFRKSSRKMFRALRKI